MALRLFVVWDDEGAVCVIAAQSAEHAYKLADELNDKRLPWPEHVNEIVAPEYAPGVVLWVMVVKP